MPKDYTDFITDMPIRSDRTHQELYYIILSKKKQSIDPTKPLEHITDWYAPVTFPMFARYTGDDIFQLDDDFEKYNRLALDYMTDNIVDVNGRIDSKALQQRDYLLSATFYDYFYYSTATKEMPHEKEWVNETMMPFTYNDVLVKKREHFAKWLTTAKSEIKNNSTTIETTLQNHPMSILLHPDINKTFHNNDLSVDNITQQLTLFKAIDQSVSNDDANDMFCYLVDWYTFYRHLEQIQKPFRPVLIGHTHYKLEEIQNEMSSLEYVYDDFLNDKKPYPFDKGL